MPQFNSGTNIGKSTYVSSGSVNQSVRLFRATSAKRFKGKSACAQASSDAWIGDHSGDEHLYVSGGPRRSGPYEGPAAGFLQVRDREQRGRRGSCRGHDRPSPAPRTSLELFVSRRAAPRMLSEHLRRFPPAHVRWQGYGASPRPRTRSSPLRPRQQRWQVRSALR